MNLAEIVNARGQVDPETVARVMAEVRGIPVFIGAEVVVREWSARTHSHVVLYEGPLDFEAVRQFALGKAYLVE